MGNLCNEAFDCKRPEVNIETLENLVPSGQPQRDEEHVKVDKEENQEKGSITKLDEKENTTEEHSKQDKQSSREEHPSESKVETNEKEKKTTDSVDVNTIYDFLDPDSLNKGVEFYSIQLTCVGLESIPKGRIEKVVQFNDNFRKRVSEGDSDSLIPRSLALLPIPLREELQPILTKINPECENLSEAVLDVVEKLYSFRKIIGTIDCLRFLSVGLTVITCRKHYGYYLHFFGLIWRFIGLNERALKYNLETVKFAEEDRNFQEKAMYLYHCGLCYKQLLNYTDALECFQKAKEIQQEGVDTVAFGKTLFYIGYCYHYMQQYEIALSIFAGSLMLSQQSNDFEIVGHSLYLIGLIHVEKRDFKSALVFQLKSRDYRLKTGDRLELIENLRQIAVINWVLENRDDAFDFYYLALEISRELKHIEKEALTLTNLAFCYQVKKNYEKAMELLKKSKELFESIEMKENLKYVIRVMKSFEEEKDKDSENSDENEKNDILEMIKMDSKNVWKI